MVEECANPACSVSFHSLREGRVFVIQVEDDSRSGVRSLLPRYYWLCKTCCRTMSVGAEKGQGAYSNDVNGRFQRDVDKHSGDVDKVGAQRRWDCNHA